MTQLVEKDLVLAPLASADSFLHAFFASHPSPQGERLPRSDDVTPRYSIRWKANEGGVWPAFDGELIVEGDEDYNGFWLILSGAHVPLGGHRVASNAARDLLREIRVYIETAARAIIQSSRTRRRATATSASLGEMIASAAAGELRSASMRTPR